MLTHPGLDRRIPLDRTGEPQKRAHGDFTSTPGHEAGITGLGYHADRLANNADSGSSAPTRGLAVPGAHIRHYRHATDAFQPIAPNEASKTRSACDLAAVNASWLAQASSTLLCAMAIADSTALIRFASPGMTA